MTAAKQIIDHTNTLFDVVGVSKASGGEFLLILGLETTEERNLDEFRRVAGEFQLYGFSKHVSPGLESILQLIHKRGFTAEPVGCYGYPLKRELNLKEEAIRTGIGKRGKSTVVLHPRYGNRLRLLAVRTNAPLEPFITPPQPDTENPLCEQCSVCIDVCPVKALEPYHLPDASLCLSNITTIKKRNGRLITCDICLHLCPANGRDSAGK